MKVRDSRFEMLRIFSMILINILSEKYKIFSGKEFYLYGGNKVFSTIFGVYLIHDNPYIRSLLWPNIFNIYLKESVIK